MAEVPATTRAREPLKVCTPGWLKSPLSPANLGHGEPIRVP